MHSVRNDDQFLLGLVDWDTYNIGHRAAKNLLKVERVVIYLWTLTFYENHKEFEWSTERILPKPEEVQQVPILLIIILIIIILKIIINQIWLLLEYKDCEQISWKGKITIDM